MPPSKDEEQPQAAADKGKGKVVEGKEAQDGADAKDEAKGKDDLKGDFPAGM